jgi:hypothetical protein
MLGGSIRHHQPLGCCKFVTSIIQCINLATLPVPSPMSLVNAHPFIERQTFTHVGAYQHLLVDFFDLFCLDLIPIKRVKSSRAAELEGLGLKAWWEVWGTGSSRQGLSTTVWRLVQIHELPSSWGVGNDSRAPDDRRILCAANRLTQSLLFIHHHASKGEQLQEKSALV